MSTNATISIKTDKDIKSVYLHWDGGVLNAGEILLQNYTNEEKILELLSYGDISVLSEKIEPNIDLPHSFEERQENVCLFYARDRGEDLELHSFNSMKELLNEFGQQHNYLFRDGYWWHCESYGKNHMKWDLLSNRIKEEEE